MKVLLAGGAGYIGSHTAIEIAKLGHDIVIADDFSNSKPEAVNRIRTIIGADFPFYEIDIADKEKLRALFAAEKPEAVIHFAGYKAVGESVKMPVAYYRNNLDTTLTLLEVMKEYGCNNLIFSSSATVYGAPDEVPIKETADVGRCTNPYGWTKYMIEVILKDAAFADSDLSVVLLRYFNPVGAHASGLIGEDPQGIPNNLMPYISQVAIGKLPCLSVFGNDYPTKDGTGVRDYIHVVDLARAHLKAMERAEQVTGVEQFNIGTGVGYSVLDIVHAYEKATGIKINYKLTDRRPGDIDECYANPAKAATVLGWKAEYNIEDMCRDSYRWQMKNPKGYDA